MKALSLFSEVGYGLSAGHAPRLNHGLFSSSSEEWETPQELFDAVDAVFHFTLDVCATPENAKCGRYFTKTDDGLSQKWRGVCWMNPPYGREIYRWVKKAYESSLEGETTVVCLLPARTDTRWWHEHVTHAAVRFIKGRVKFSGRDPAPFPSALAVFGKSPSLETVILPETHRKSPV